MLVYWLNVRCESGSSSFIPARETRENPMPFLLGEVKLESACTNSILEAAA